MEASWKSSESALLICESVLQASINTFQLKNLSPTNSVYTLIPFLRRNLTKLLCNEHFEVRRIASQLLSSLARSFILYRVNIDSNIPTTLINAIDTSQQIKPLHALLTNAVWLSQCIKENQHLLEVFLPLTDFENLFNCDDNLYFHYQPDWAREVQGRLAEVENREIFHSSLFAMKQNDSENKPMLLELLMDNCHMILTMMDRFFTPELLEASSITLL